MVLDTQRVKPHAFSFREVLDILDIENRGAVASPAKFTGDARQCGHMAGTWRAD